MYINLILYPGALIVLGLIAGYVVSPQELFKRMRLFDDDAKKSDEHIEFLDNQTQLSILRSRFAYYEKNIIGDELSTYIIITLRMLPFGLLALVIGYISNTTPYYFIASSCVAIIFTSLYILYSKRPTP